MTQTAKPVRILAFNDDPSITEMLPFFLESQGYEVTRVKQGGDAIHLMQEVDPDLILLDLKKPEMNGVEICRRVRAISTVPILVLSAQDEPGKVASLLDAGADDHLTKPVTGNMLLARLNTLTRRIPRNGQPLPVRPVHAT